MIRHTVAFRLHHDPESAEEQAFLDATLELAGIPGVERFERLSQVSESNEFRFALSMEFADVAAYADYNAHPTHTAFVAGRWVPEVAAFQEADFTLLDEPAEP